MKLNMRGRTVLITGASSGIGRSLSRCFAEDGARLVISSCHSDRAALEKWRSELGDLSGTSVTALTCDLSTDQGPESLYISAVEKAGEPDILVNNAGIMAYGNFHQLPMDRQAALLHVNAAAYMKLMRLALPGMIERGFGRVLNIVSVSAFQPCPHHAVYGATKAFTQSLSEAVNSEIRGTGVRVLTFNPSYTDTPLLRVDGFPDKLWWYRVSGLGDPEKTAVIGYRAFLRDRQVYIPGIINRMVHTLVLRFIPRRVKAMISELVLRGN